MPENTDQARPVIVLVRPQLGENIGKAARAMLNFGLTEMRLVAPRDGWPNPSAGPAAAGADIVLEKAQVFETLAEAVADCAHVYAPVRTPEQAAREAMKRMAELQARLDEVSDSRESKESKALQDALAKLELPKDSNAARELAEALGVGVRSVDPHWRLGTEGLAPDDVIGADGFECRVVLTPGHSSDSASLVLRSAAITGLLTGDTVLGRGTTVVAHPDGRLSDYLASLRVLRERAESAGATDVLPGHGPRLADPVGVIDYYLAHRAERLEQVRAALARTDPGEDRVWAVVERVYADVPQTLWPAAAQSVRAQIDFLEQAGPGRAD